MTSDPMNPKQYDEVRQLFLEVFDREPAERKQFLAEHATPSQRAEIAELLAHHDDNETFLDPADLPTMVPDRAATAALAPQPGDRIGPYVVRRLLGEGGFGIVCEAEQTEPVRRIVALKVLKGGLDTREVIGRFESERQALAMMDHRFIAKVLDAGATDQGRPFFVMEAVDGVPITDFCENNGLDVEARLRLLLQVCEAVQHAHQKGIIHRDIKPSNVLVTYEGERNVPKIIDFGIAKALRPELTGRTTVTAHGQLVGTPAYMSPEQADLGTLDIDTRSDIYSLGALLYELLVGAPPFSADELRGKGLVETRRILREEEPVKPSSRVITEGSLSSAPTLDSRTLQRQLRGDLDWIVLRAMEKDRARRYQTAYELAADIKRHLAFEPVLAGPPSTVYRFTKFARRHRAGLVASVIATLALATGLGGILYEHQRAETQSEVAGTVIEFVGNMFADGRPVDMEALARAGTAIESEQIFADEPLVRGRILGWIAFAHSSYGDYAKAEYYWLKALEIRRAKLGLAANDTLMTMNNLALMQQRQGKLAAAEQMSREAVKLAREHLSEPNTAKKSTIRTALKATMRLGAVLLEERQFEEAERLLTDVIAAQNEALGPEAADTLESMMHLGLLQLATGMNQRAKAQFARIVHVYGETSGEKDSKTLAAAAELARAKAELGELEEAKQELEKTLDRQCERPRRNARSILKTEAYLADVIAKLGATGAAEASHQETAGR